MTGTHLRIFFDLLWYKTRCSLRAEISRLYLNYVWWAFEPLLTMAICYIVFGVFMHSPTPHYGLFILIGTMQWQWFANTVLHAAGSVVCAAPLMARIRLHKIFFPLEIFLRDGFKQLFVLVLFAVFLAFYPVPICLSWLALPLIVLLQAVFILGCAIFFAALVPFVPDMRIVLASAVHILFFASGIFFDIDSYVLPQHRSIMYLNPMAGLLREYRRIIINGNWPDWEYLGLASLGCTALLAAAVHVIHRFDNIYPRLCR